MIVTFCCQAASSLCGRAHHEDAEVTRMTYVCAAASFFEEDCSGNVASKAKKALRMSLPCFRSGSVHGSVPVVRLSYVQTRPPASNASLSLRPSQL